MVYINWKEQGSPFLDFTEELTYEWMRNGFSREECKEWLDIGMKAEDAEFCGWLRDEVKVKSLEILNNLNTENKYQELDLREQHKEYLESNKLSKEIIEQIKNFDYLNLTSEQKLLVDKLIPNKRLRELHQEYGLCQECQQPNITRKTRYSKLGWCQPCSTKHFQTEFKNWTSGNQEIDEIIQKYQLRGSEGVNLEWIPYNRFKNIEYLAEGGFGKVYRATWKDGQIQYWDIKNGRWKRQKDAFNDWGKVVLKSLNHSQNITADFLHEITCHKLTEGISIVHFYGISQDPQTGNYLMVMWYMRDGDLRHYLQNNRTSIGEGRLEVLCQIPKGLINIHKRGLTHRDLHPGNVVNSGGYICITDLGLCRPANETDKNKIFGVLPYVAPEVLRGQPYIPASDIYSFSMIIYEAVSGLSPYHDMSHDEFLAVKICQGLRPKFPTQIKIPQLLLDLISKCWDEDPKKRPTTEELYNILSAWNEEVKDKKNTRFYQQIQETEEFNQKLPEEVRFSKYEIHPQTFYTSKLINTKKINELSQKIEKISQSADFNVDEIDDWLKECEKQGAQNQIEIPPKK